MVRLYKEGKEVAFTAHRRSMCRLCVAARYAHSFSKFVKANLVIFIRLPRYSSGYKSAPVEQRGFGLDSRKVPSGFSSVISCSSRERRD